MNDVASHSFNNTVAALSGADCPARSSFLPLMVSMSSLIGCLYVIFTYLYVRALRQHPAGIMFGMSVYGAIYQFLYLLDRASASISCSQMAVFVDLFLTGQETYMLIFAIDLLLTQKNPFSASKGLMKKYHLYGGLWSISCALVSQFDDDYALFGFCWINNSSNAVATEHSTSSGDKSKTPAHAKLTPGLFFALYIVVVYCTSLVALLRTWNTFLKGLPDTFTTRHRIHRHLKYYVGCYFGYWTLVLACYAIFALMPRDDPTSATTPTDGQSTTDLTDDSSNSGGMRCRVWHVLSSLLLAKGMVMALIWTRTSNILMILEQLRTNGYVDLPPHDDSINWALRLEILTNTTKGICESVERAERQARVSSMSTSSAEGESARRSSGGFSGSSRGDGTRLDVSIEVDYHDQKDNYTQIESIILENRNDSGASGQRSDGVMFYDYAPHIFRRLRLDAKISAASYRDSMQQTTKERVSEGKSGAFFYFTEDRKYVVKTMTHEELKFLLSILPKYNTFMQSHPNTFVTKFFGCHAVTMYGKTVFFMVMQSVFDTPLQIHERFDLKGSWVGRLEGRKPTGTVATCKFCATEYVVGGSHGQLCDVRRGEGNLRHEYDQVGKDLNWNRHMALPRATARAVAKQLTIDSDFLCSINCIDYSLLVGIHHRSFNVSHYSSAAATVMNPVAAGVSGGEGPPRMSYSSAFGRPSGGSSFAGPQVRRSKPFHQATEGGMTVDEVHGPGIYYMGLIDILQQWNLRKRVEHVVRAYLLFQDKGGISVVNPRQYAERFQQRVLKELIYDESLDSQGLGIVTAHSSSAASSFTLAEREHTSPRSNPGNFSAGEHLPFDPFMYESGRTLSTVINSFDLGGFDERLSVALSSQHLPAPIHFSPTPAFSAINHSPQSAPTASTGMSSIPVMPLPAVTPAANAASPHSNSSCRTPSSHSVYSPPDAVPPIKSPSGGSRRRAATTATPYFASPYVSSSSSSSYSASPDSNASVPIRLSGGLVMEPPGGFFPGMRTSLPLLRPTTNSIHPFASPQFMNLPRGMRHPLAPLTPSPRGRRFHSDASSSSSCTCTATGRRSSAAGSAVSAHMSKSKCSSSSGSNCSRDRSSSGASSCAVIPRSSQSSNTSNHSTSININSNTNSSEQVANPNAPVATSVPSASCLNITTPSTGRGVHGYQIVRTPTYPDKSTPPVMTA